jgi:hypothetical protein
LFDNDLTASLLFTVVFLLSILGLMLLLAWLEQPPSERWRPAVWRRRSGVSPASQVAPATVTSTRPRHRAR